MTKNYNFTKIAYMWLTEKKNIKIQTYQKYDRTINCYIKKFLDNILISKITKEDIINFFGKLKNDEISLSYQKTILYIVKASVSYAYDKGYCEYIDLKDIKIKASKKSIYVFSKEEQIKLENELKRDINIRKLCLLLCMYTGLRIGEICGLKWEDINLSGGYLKVTKTIQRIKNPKKNGPKTILIASTPKSETSNRIVPIPAFILEYLKQFKNKNNYYILSNSVKIYDTRLFEIFYKRILKRCGITICNFHRIRHLFACRAIESKMDIKTLSEILGHSSVKITLELYVHPSYELKKTSIEHLVEFMSDKTEECHF